MNKAGFISERITVNTKRSIKDATSIVVSNYGSTAINVTVSGVTRPVPPVHPTLLVPIAPFKIESFGHGFDVDFLVEFPSGSGDAIIDVLKIQTC